MFQRFLFAILLALPGIRSWSQVGPPMRLPVDTSVLLPAAEVIDQPLRAAFSGSRRESWSQSELERLPAGHLGDLLSQESGVFIKSYGLGGSAVTSIRGGAAGHTSVLWNGLPLQSPMLGQLDFSLLPLAFTDGVELQYGGQTAAWGAGAIGGVIGLRNRADFDKGTFLNLHSTFGSFGLSDQQAKLQLGKERWRSVTRLLHRRADNDFPYRLRPDLPEKRQTNAAIRQMGVLQEVYWRPKDSRELGVHVWMQEADREIPPTTVQNRSEASQRDAFVRTALHWKALGKSVAWQARAGLFRESLDYRDDLILLRSLSRFWTAAAEVDGVWYLDPRRQLQFGLGHTWMQAEADAYGVKPQQHRTAPFVGLKQELGAWRLQLNLRQAFVDGRPAPLVPDLNLAVEPLAWLDVRAKVSRNYRLPTFNDLYWRPGGNPDLQPESGWGQELTLQPHRTRKNRQWSYSLTGFHRLIDNWILWSPLAGQPFWSPDNLTKVRSRGLEQRLNWRMTAGAWRLQFAGGYDYIRSTNEVAVDNPRLAAGDPLAYVPEHQAFGRVGLQWKALEADYSHRYTGPVHTLNAGVLSGYQLGFLSFRYAFHRPRWSGRLFLRLDNVWNEQYRVVERRVMPGRQAQGGIKWEVGNGK